jgi:hypothetical protein
MRTTGLLAFLAFSILPVSAYAADFTVQATFPTYTINGQPNPTLTLMRGHSYTFDISSVGHPFDIKTAQGAGTANQYSGFTSQGIESGTGVVFSVPSNAPSTLFYDCELHTSMSGPITIVSQQMPATGPLAVGLLTIALCGAGFFAFRRRVASQA